MYVAISGDLHRRSLALFMLPLMSLTHSVWGWWGVGRSYLLQNCPQWCSGMDPQNRTGCWRWRGAVCLPPFSHPRHTENTGGRNTPDLTRAGTISSCTVGKKKKEIFHSSSLNMISFHFNLIINSKWFTLNTLVMPFFVLFGAILILQNIYFYSRSCNIIFILGELVYFDCLFYLKYIH